MCLREGSPLSAGGLLPTEGSRASPSRRECTRERSSVRGLSGHVCPGARAGHRVPREAAGGRPGQAAGRRAGRAPAQRWALLWSREVTVFCRATATFLEALRSSGLSGWCSFRCRTWPSWLSDVQPHSSHTYSLARRSLYAYFCCTPWIFLRWDSREQRCVKALSHRLHL